MTRLHIDRSTETQEDYVYIDSPTALQLRQSIEKCGVDNFTFIELTGIWREKQHDIKSRLFFTRAIKNRFRVLHDIFIGTDHYNRWTSDLSVTTPEKRLPIVLGNGELSYCKMKNLVDIEVANKIAVQFVQHGTFPEEVNWYHPPDFQRYIDSLDTSQ